MAASHRLDVRHRWLFPLLAALLVLGHTCELPAYAGLAGHHADAAHEAEPAGHDHDEEHALTCAGALVLRGPGPAQPDPGRVTPIASPAMAPVVLPPARAVAARPARSSADPPLFLLFSSLLI